MKYTCPCCNTTIELGDKNIQDCLKIVVEMANRNVENNALDRYEAMIRFLAENSIDLPVASCVKVL